MLKLFITALISAAVTGFMMWRKLKKNEKKYVKQSNSHKSEISVLRNRDRDANATLRRYEKENIEHKDMAVLFPEIVKMILSAKSTEELAKFILRGVNRLTYCENIAVFFADKACEKLELAGTRGLQDVLSKPLTIAVGDGHVGYAAETGLILEAKVLNGDSDLMRKQISKNAIPGFTPEITVPMMFRGILYGVICVVDIPAKASLPRERLCAIGAVGAVGLENIRLLIRFMSAADIDENTGLYRIGQYEPTIKKELERVIRFKRPLTVMELKIPSGGDSDEYRAKEVISTCVDFLKKKFRNIDTGFRLSPEVIGILLPGTDSDGAFKINDELIRQIPDLGNGKDISVGPVSVRYIVVEPGNEENAEMLIAALSGMEFTS